MTQPNPRPLAEMLEAYAERNGESYASSLNGITTDPIVDSKIDYVEGFLAAVALLLPCVEALEYLDNDEQPLIEKTLRDLRDRLEGK